MNRFKRLLAGIMMLVLSLNYSVVVGATPEVNREEISSLSMSDKLSDEVRELKQTEGEQEFLIQYHSDLKLDDDSSQQAMSLSGMDRKARTVSVVGQLKKDALNKQGPLIEKLKKERIDYKSFFVVNMLQVKTTYQKMSEIAKDPAVKKVYLNNKIQVIDPERIKPQYEAMADPSIWNIKNVKADAAWDMGYKGAGVVIGIIDSGADWSHPAIRAQFRAYNPSNPTKPDANQLKYSWVDEVGYSSSPYDDNGHGTHCIGTMVGKIPGGATIGVAPKAKWIAAKALDAYGSAYNSDLLSTGEWMIAPGGDPTKAPDVINNSWGGSDITSEWYRDMVKSWRYAGIIPIFAAGNQMPKEPAPWPGSIVDPAYYPESFAVGALDSSNALAKFSKLGPSTFDERIIKPEISAPGVDIYSSLPGGKYGLYSGTSMAAPHVAGVAALILSANLKLSVDDVLLSIQRSATPLTSSKFPASPNMGFGYGIINAKNAIDKSMKGIPKGSLSGKITDSASGRPVIGARITIQEKPASNASFTEGDGIYWFNQLQVGKYTLNIYHPRYGNTRQNVTVTAGKNATVNVKLVYVGNASGSLKYDDGSAENAIVAVPVNHGYGVAMRPARYGQIKSIKAFFWGSGYPAIGGTKLKLSIYAADENMLPTNRLLLAPISVTVQRGVFNTFDISKYGLKTDQPFIPVFTQINSGDYSPAVGIDDNSPRAVKHGYYYNGYSFTPLSDLGEKGTMMIRAEMSYSMSSPAINMELKSPVKNFENRLYTNYYYLDLAGTVTDADEVIIYNNGVEDRTLPVINKAYKGNVYLDEGLNKLNAVAVLRDRNVAFSKEIQITLDSYEPEISLPYLEEYTNTRSFLIKGKVIDPNLTSFQINGVETEVSKDGSFSKNMLLPEFGYNNFDLKAEDAAGNIAEDRIWVYTEKDLRNIKIINLPAKLNYYTGQSLDLTGLKVIGIDDRGVSETLPVTEAEVSGFNSLAPQKNQMLTVRVGDLTATFPVNIIARPPAKVQPFSGKNRYHTAALISQRSYAKSDVAVIASGLAFPDALSAGPLASALNAPILLTHKDRLSIDTGAELTRLGVKKVIILGGTGAVSETVETLMRNRGIKVQRIKGANRYLTALEVANYLKGLKGAPKGAIISSGIGFADALSIGGYAAQNGLPILTVGSSIRPEILAFLKANKVQEVIIPGGASVVSDEIQKQIEAMGLQVQRISGSNRERTSAAIANTFYKSATQAVVSNGMDFPDALAAAPYAAKMKAPILLIRKDTIHESISTYLKKSSVITIDVTGGEGVISAAARKLLIETLR